MVVDLSKLSVEELEALREQARAAASAPALPTDKPLSEWSTDQLLMAKQGAGDGPLKLTVRPRHVYEMTAPQSQREAGEPLKPSFLATGGTLGAIAGTPAGLPGMIAGGAAGTALGAGAYDIYRDVRRRFVDDPSVSPSTTNRLMEPLKEAAIDAGFGVALGSAPAVSAGWRAAKRGVLGIGAEERTLAAEADRLGVGLGITELTNQPLVRTFNQTVSRVPFIGMTARRAEERKISQVGQAWQDMLGGFGPLRGQAEIGAEMGVQAKGKFGDFLDLEVKPAYTTVDALAAKEGAIAPAQKFIQTAADAAFELNKAKPSLSSGKEMSQVAPEYIKKFLDEVQELPVLLSVDNLRWLKRNVDDLMDKAEKDGFQWKQAHALRDAVEEIIKSTAKSGASPAAAALVKADDIFHRGMLQFENTTGQKFTRTDRNIFQKGFERPGSINEDELFRVALNMKSPEAVEQLDRLVGTTTMKGVARRYLDEAFQASQKKNEKGQRFFDVDHFATQLKLNDPNSSQYKALEKLYMLQGGDIKDLKKLLEITEKVHANLLPDVSTYVARRMMLGGTLAAGANAYLGPVMHVSTLAGTVLSAAGAHILTSPRQLKQLLKMYDPKVPRYTKLTIGARLLRLYNRDWDAQEPPLIPPPNANLLQSSAAEAENALGAR